MFYLLTGETASSSPAGTQYHEASETADSAIPEEARQSRGPGHDN